jgi:hypothetical protein
MVAQALEQASPALEPALAEPALVCLDTVLAPAQALAEPALALGPDSGRAPGLSLVSLELARGPASERRLTVESTEPRRAQEQQQEPVQALEPSRLHRSAKTGVG